MASEGIVYEPYPVNFEVQYPERLSRWMIFFKWLFLIPHYIVVGLLSIVVMVTTAIAWLCILFTARYPRGLHNLAVGWLRWELRVYAYMYLLRDEYPPFSLSAGDYPVSFEVEYPERLSRWKIFFKGIAVMPHYFVLGSLSCAIFGAWILAFFAILFTGKYPPGLFDLWVGVERWSMRVTTYMLLLRDGYPPFRLAR